jgi:hypothetical protein
MIHYLSFWPLSDHVEEQHNTATTLYSFATFTPHDPVCHMIVVMVCST